ncbi:MAG: hypothetical protein OXF74_07770 [Rhodobacteraceae bacterium]|nr:hypothetical protein [Paracoccaceae bacterium]
MLVWLIAWRKALPLLYSSAVSFNLRLLARIADATAGAGIRKARLYDSQAIENLPDSYGYDSAMSQVLISSLEACDSSGKPGNPDSAKIRRLP